MSAVANKGAREDPASQESSRSASSGARERAWREHIQYHRDGTVWACGRTIDGVPTGYWEWFRKNGVRMRSGRFEEGRQIGDWTTYDKDGAVHKVTTMKPAR